MSAINAIYRLALAFWVGGAALFTFVLTPTLFRTQPRDLAGEIVGTLFPSYFHWGIGCGAVALICLLILRGRRFVAALILLVLMLGATTYQSLFLEPRAAALKERIGSFETTSRDHPLRREFSRLHAVSAAANLAVLAAGATLVALRAGERRRKKRAYGNLL